jgi:hypothetical protein
MKGNGKPTLWVTCKAVPDTPKYHAGWGQDHAGYKTITNIS